MYRRITSSHAPKNKAAAVPRKRVLTLTEDSLLAASNALLSLMSDSGYVPDAIVGIETGGVHVVNALALSASTSVFRCRLRRPTTETKERLSAGTSVLKRLPYGVTNRIRLVEDRQLEKRRQVIPSESDELATCLDEISATVMARRLCRVAIVDDAVDSGATLGCVRNGLRQRLSADVALKTAVLTQTRIDEKVLVVPDFALHQQVLLRFPWSFDFRGAS